MLSMSSGDTIPYPFREYCVKQFEHLRMTTATYEDLGETEGIQPRESRIQ